MLSLTGFGSGSAPLGDGRVVIEIRSLNHKHQDVRMRMPGELSEHGFFLEQTARAQLGRGRYDMSVRHEGQVGRLPHLDEEKLKALFGSLEKVRDEVAPGTALSLDALLSIPDLMTTQGPDPEEARRSLKNAFFEASAELAKMRAVEGESLRQDLEQRLTSVQGLRAKIADGSQDLVAHHRTRLTERLEKLLSDTAAVSADRLEHEVALIADRSDITEELVRLDSHFSQLAHFLASQEPVGRKLDFLLQEVGREVNTIGSKSQHAPVSHLVVEMKSEVERLREQVQNVD